MNTEKIDLFLLANKDNFSDSHFYMIRQMLASADDATWARLQALKFDNPTVILIVSIFAGGLGIDRFMIGDVGMGVLKLLTGGLCGILTIIDWFTIMDKVRAHNFEKLNLVLGGMGNSTASL